MAVVFCIAILSLALPVLSQLECRQRSGYDSETGEYVLEPSSPSDTVHLAMTEDPNEARTASLCHVGCIRYITGASTNGTILNGTALFNQTMNSTSGITTPTLVILYTYLVTPLCYPSNETGCFRVLFLLYIQKGLLSIAIYGDL